MPAHVVFGRLTSVARSQGTWEEAASASPPASLQSSSPGVLAFVTAHVNTCAGFRCARACATAGGHECVRLLHWSI